MKTRISTSIPHTPVLLLLLAFSFFFPPDAFAQTTVTRARQYFGLGSLWCVAYGPQDGKYILTGGFAGAFLWEVETGEAVRRFYGHSLGVSSLAFSPDGTKILTGSSDRTARLWNPADGTELRTFAGHASGVTSVAFSPDGTKVLTGSADGTAKLWNVANGAVIRTFAAHTSGVLSVAFSPDGSNILTGGEDNTAKLWNLSNGALLRTFSGHLDWVSAVAFSPDGKKILTASWDRTARIWNVLDGTVLQTLSGHSVYLSTAAFSPDGTKALTGSTFEAILWDVASGTAIHTFSGSDANYDQVAFSPDSKKVLTGGWWPHNLAKLWNVSDGTEICTFYGHTDWFTSIAFSPDGTRVLTASDDLTAKLWNATDGTLIRTLRGHSWIVTSVAFSRDGMKILTGSSTWPDFLGEAKLWDASTGAVLRTFDGHTSEVTSVAFSPDATTILTGGRDRTVKLWNAANGALLRTYSGHTSDVLSVAFSPSGTEILTGSRDTTARLWNASNGSVLRIFSGHLGPVTCAAFSPDGAKLVTASEDGTAKLWNTSGGSAIRTFRASTSIVKSAAFSPDGTKVATGSWDARLWNVSDGTLLRIFYGHAYWVESLAFSPDGTCLATASFDGTARLWDIYRAKTVIVAGGGAFSGNAIAEQTKELAAYAYKICRRRGYAPNEIQYLNAFGNQDADGDGINDVDAPATITSFHNALDRFTSDTSRLFIYMVDHGYRVGNGMYFQMNPTQTLSAADLDAWLDARQNNSTYAPCRVTLIVDSCYSGNFLSACKPPPVRRRLTIASTTSDTVAVFLPPPSLTSFSYQFLGGLYMGYKVQQAFASARQFFSALGVANQTPWIDANGDGKYSPGVDDAPTGPAAEEFFGASWAYAAAGGWEPPAFEDVTDNLSPPLGTTVTIWARMLPNQVPQRVWATILPPSAKPLAGQALTDLPRVELWREGTTPRWSAKFGGFDTMGTYVVAHVAQFAGERITQPVYSHLSVGAPANPLPIKAILVSGKAASGTISSQTIALANLAYRVSRHRGYDAARIRYLSAFGNQDADGDRMNDVFGAATVANVTNSLAIWAAADCKQLLIYLVGPGEKVGGQPIFRLSPTEALTSAALDARLDVLQSSGGVQDIVVVADFPFASVFLRGCKPPTGKHRVLIAGTDSPTALFLAPPQCTSFSFNFLSAAHMGHNLKESFDAAQQFFGAWTGYRQKSWLDDTGDGVSNKWDGPVARTLYWGYPWAFAGPEGGELPFVLDAGPRGFAVASRSVVLWAILMEGPVPQSVAATIIPPSVAYTPGQPVTGFPTVALSREGQTWRWSALPQTFSEVGTYTILFQAVYEDDRLSAPVLGSLSVGTDARRWRLY